MHTDGSVQIAPLGTSDSATAVQLRLIGRMPLGRAPVRLQWQVAPLGTPFTSTAIISGTSSQWTDVLTTGVVITQNVTGLTPDTPYHWRVRLLYRPGNRLGQSAGRWIHVPWNGWAEADFRTAAGVPIAGLSAVNDGPTTLGQLTTLTATVTAGTDVSYAWAFGDGEMGSGSVVTHTYPDAGVYTAVVTASNSVSVVTATTAVTITDVPIAGLSAVNDSPTLAGWSTTLTATVTAGSNVTYTWAFGDGSTGSGSAVGHTYPDVGVYTAVVTASNSVSVLTATTTVTVTPRVITYAYDPLNRLIGANYSTPSTGSGQAGESFEYAYDAVGNRTAYTATIESTSVTTYTYDAANRLTSAGGVAYTWDDRGNLTNDGVFTYTYNAAGRLVRAQGVTVTLVYTYNASGLRVAQSVDGDETTFAWDWASGLPEMLSQGTDLYLVGHETLGEWDGAAWAYHLPDALGSVRQVADGAGYVTSSREWTPYGVGVDGTQAGLGYTGEWQDPSLEMTYLRARWYDASVGRFTRRDPWHGSANQPQSWNAYIYAYNTPLNTVDPTGMVPSCGDTCSYSCRCGWIDWSHAGPRTARTIKDRILTDVTGGSPDYFVLHTGLASVLPPTEGLAVVRKNLSLQERKEVALGIFMSLEEEVENAHYLFEALQTEMLGLPLTHSGYSLEDLPSDLISFYVAWMTEEGLVDTEDSTATDKLKDIVGPICHVLDTADCLDVLNAFEKAGLLYEKNFWWTPFIVPGDCSDVHNVLAEKCGDVDTSWPSEFLGITPEPEREKGKWWWWRGPWMEAHIEPSEFEGVYLYDVTPPPLWAYPPLAP
jgi:RHS repeat-associated protein